MSAVEQEVGLSLDQINALAEVVNGEVYSFRNGEQVAVSSETVRVDFGRNCRFLQPVEIVIMGQSGQHIELINPKYTETSVPKVATLRDEQFRKREVIFESGRCNIKEIGKQE